jgi:heme/copper-type cytochrome/quinol oxidase subunit 2
MSLIITLIAYFIIRSNSKADDNDEEDNEEKTNVPKTLLITFVSSLIILVALKYLVSYMNSKNFFQKGGVDMSERLTIVADDVDVDLIE